MHSSRDDWGRQTWKNVGTAERTHQQRKRKRSELRFHHVGGGPDQGKNEQCSRLTDRGKGKRLEKKAAEAVVAKQQKRANKKPDTCAVSQSGEEKDAGREVFLGESRRNGKRSEQKNLPGMERGRPRLK